jgi:hypothetical protein
MEIILWVPILVDKSPPIHHTIIPTMPELIHPALYHSKAQLLAPSIEEEGLGHVHVHGRSQRVRLYLEILLDFWESVSSDSI